MANQPRKHHYVPKFYLSGFTTSGNEDGTLHVLDQSQLRQWESTPSNAAHQRDFYAIHAGSDVNPMVIEKALAEIEGKCRNALRDIIKNEVLPKDESFYLFLNFVALMAVRVPNIRKIISDFIDRTTKDIFHQCFNTDAGWEQFKKLMEAKGMIVPFTQNEMKDFIEGEGYDVDFEQTWHVKMMLETGAMLVPVLAERKWSLWIADNNAPDFICSDRPVCLSWKTAMPETLSPGFGNPNTVVSVPINRRKAAFGSFEGPSVIIIAQSEDVASINSMTCMYANQLYSSEPDFTLMMKDRIGHASDLLSASQDEAEEIP